MEYIRNLRHTILKDEFILCYCKKGILPSEWTCEQGYRSLDEIDEHIHHSLLLRNKITTVIPTKRYFPLFFKKWVIHSSFHPSIYFRPKMSYGYMDETED